MITVQNGGSLNKNLCPLETLLELKLKSSYCGPKLRSLNFFSTNFHSLFLFLCYLYFATFLFHMTSIYCVNPHRIIIAEEVFHQCVVCAGVMLNKVNELIDETSATPSGKCHCCGEDLKTAHVGGEFECVDCSKHFKLKSSLERHRRVIHLEGETYSCPECEARCPDKGTLARHMYTHTGFKPYSCTRCNKQFSRKYHLERHIIQTGCDGNPRPAHPCQVKTHSNYEVWQKSNVANFLFIIVFIFF